MQDLKLQRINRLLDAAKQRAGTDTRLAQKLDRAPQLISNWRHGLKRPSIEAQLDVAALAGLDLIETALLGLIEDGEEPRKAALQEALRTYQIGKKGMHEEAAKETQQAHEAVKTRNRVRKELSERHEAKSSFSHSRQTARLRRHIQPKTTRHSTRHQAGFLFPTSSRNSVSYRTRITPKL